MELSYKNSSGIPDSEIASRRGELGEYLGHLRAVAESAAYDAPESSLNLASDEGFMAQVLDLARETGGDDLKYVFLIGIGGSNLGAKAVYDAHFLYRDMFGVGEALGENSPKLICLDTVHGVMAAEALALLEEQVTEPEEIMVVVVSKSGSTMETAVNFEIVRDALMAKFGIEKTASRIVAITDEGSPLWNAAADRRVRTLQIPKQVGGRYSVFSPAGLFPLALLGIDIGKFVAAARTMRDACLRESDNPALDSALIASAHYESGRRASTLFVFGAELESVGKWWWQLLGESLGKTDADGNRSGMELSVSVGSTDLHSVGQLYLGGPQNRFTTFVSLGHSGGARTPLNYLLFPSASGRDPDTVLDAIREGTKAAYAKEGLPFAEAKLSSAADIGAFMQWKMIETMLLGKLMNVNAFDQPAVELYKKETRRILGDM